MICAVAQCSQGRCIALKQVSGDNKKPAAPCSGFFASVNLQAQIDFLCSKNGVNRQEAKGDLAGW